MPGNNTRYTLADWIENLSIEHAVKLLLQGFFGQTAPSGTSPGIPVLNAAGTIHGNNLIASGSVTIPIGARDIGILLKTGTGTYTTAEGTPSLTALSAINIAGPIAVAITVQLGNPGTADYNYST